MSRNIGFVSILFFLAGHLIVGQTYSVKGVVRESKSRETIPACNVYLSGGTIGTMTDENGNFTISGLNPGVYDLIVSHVSYNFKSVAINITSKDIDLGSVFLKEKPIQTTFTEVQDKVDRKWQRQFERFKKYILGDHFRKKDIEIPNAYEAEFKRAGNALVKKETFTLQINNNYTGYEIFYPVQDFLLGNGIQQFMVGYPRFKSMESDDPDEVQKWEANRGKSYEGSLRHFFKSLLSGSLEQEFFESELTDQDPLNRNNKPNAAVSISGAVQNGATGSLKIEDTSDDRIKKIVFKDFLKVRYLKESMANGQGQLTYLKANKGFVFVYTNGLLVDPMSITAYGYLSTEGLYEMLPFDFEYDIDPSGNSQIKQPKDQIGLDVFHPSLSAYTEALPQEKTYIHTDRKYYAPGETVWFQAYLSAGKFNEPSPLSNNIYVELYSSEKRLIDQKLVRADGGFGNGAFNLSDSLQSGSYVLRAYTNWMRNFNKAFFFEKELIVIANDPAITPVSTTANDIDLQFFPEGGNLVQGVPNQVAFKAIDASGKGVPVSGTVYDNDGLEIAQLAVQHDGMGLFEFTPQEGKVYSTRLGGQNTTVELPKALAKGFVITVNNNLPDDIVLVFRSNDATPNKGNLSAVVHTRGVISRAFKVDLSKNVTITRIPKKDIPTGISHITLFDKSGNAVAERLAFINNPGYGNLEFSIDKPDYKSREMVSAKIKVTDEEGKPVAGVFSLSAIDLGQTADRQPANTIYSELLLTSDLKGYVHNPMYYFDTSNPEASRHLDLLMMTHGWTRFVWDNVLQQKYPDTQHFVEQSISLRGKLRTLSGKKKETGTVTLLNKSVIPPTFLETNTASDGSFRFDTLSIFEDQEIVVQGVNKKGRPNVTFELNTAFIVKELLSDFKSVIQKTGAGDTKIFAEKKDYRDLIDQTYNFDSTAITELDDVVVEGSKFKADEAVLKSPIYGRGDGVVDFSLLSDAVNASSSPLEAIIGKLPGVRILRDRGQITMVNIRNRRSIRGGLIPALLLLDDIPTEIDFLLSIPASHIDRMVTYKGISSSAMFGSAGEGGALAFYTKTDIGPVEIERPGIYITRLKNSYHQPREFYAPKYNVQKPEHIKPDSRIVLHWQPMIILDESGEAEIKFWNSDVDTEVLIDLQGLSAYGNPFFATKIYEIKKN